MKNIFIPLSLIFLFCIGCANRVPITNNLISQYSLTPKRLKNLQYFVSEDIILKNEEINTSSELTRDEKGLSATKEVTINRVFIKEGTPGIVESIGDDKMEISFEYGERLSFHCDSNNTASLYRLSPAKRVKQENGSFEVPIFIYRDREYYMYHIKDIYLEVELNEIHDVEEIEIIVPGRTVK